MWTKLFWTTQPEIWLGICFEFTMAVLRNLTLPWCTFSLVFGVANGSLFWSPSSNFFRKLLQNTKLSFINDVIKSWPRLKHKGMFWLHCIETPELMIWSSPQDCSLFKFVFCRSLGLHLTILMIESICGIHIWWCKGCTWQSLRSAFLSNPICKGAQKFTGKSLLVKSSVTWAILQGGNLWCLLFVLPQDQCAQLFRYEFRPYIKYMKSSSIRKSSFINQV